jgi:hypothetical protein
MTRETRSLPGSEIRSIDEKRHEITARVVRYGVSDHHGSVWRHKVFADSLSRSLPPSCLHHDLSRPIGRVIDYTDTPNALDLRIRLASTEDVPDARVAWSLLSDGTLREWSTTFERKPGGQASVPSNQRSAYGELPAREMIHRAELIEVSPVTVASVPGTQTLAMRGRAFGAVLDPDDLAERRAISRLEGRLVGLSSRSLSSAELERRSRDVLDRSVLHLSNRQLERQIARKFASGDW